MELTFYKYQGTGNDFVMIDNRTNHFDKADTKLVAELCDRRFGVGADGLILLESSAKADFKMVYYNADGNTSTMCGNGGRCIVSFAKFLKVIDNETTFEAIDGLHHATINNGIVSLHMIDVDTIKQFDTHLFADTGSPHHVQLVENIEDFDVFNEGAKLRYSDLYANEGSNINFVEAISSDCFNVRTYERGVEDETYSCGTGVTAVAVTLHYSKKVKDTTIQLKTKGGDLTVSFDVENSVYKNIYLIGPAKQVFKGTWI